MSPAQLSVRMAQNSADLAAAQRLRYRVFIKEMGGSGGLVDHVDQREVDRFDAHASHLLLEDRARPEGARVVGTYRLMTGAQAQQAGGFYSASEYDLTPLIGSGQTLMELGRSCIHPDYRGGPGLMLLWQGLAAHVMAKGVDLLFGVASFPGTDLAALAQPLSYLHHHHRACDKARIQALPGRSVPMDILPPEAIDRKAALAAMPPLIKAYLRMGAVVGEGAFVDHAFNTVDVSLIVDVAAIDARQRQRYTRAQPA